MRRILSIPLRVALTLLGLSMTLIVGPALLDVCKHALVYAQILQTTGPRPSFEVATIKPSKAGQTGLNMMMSPGAFLVRSASLVDLIRFGYRLRSPDQIVGAAPWMKTELYDLQAKADSSTMEAISKLSPDGRIDSSRLMLQSLLADRFQLVVHTAVEERSIYALVLAKGGARLSLSAPHSSTDPTPSRAAAGTLGYTTPTQITAKSATISMLADWLARQEETGNRIIVDETGLTGNYDFVLTGLPSIHANTPTSSAEPSTTSLFTLLPEQLGLELVPRKGPVDVLIIDRAERPSEN
jgi:uncharacterized protein (TIGR03435 family)